MRGGGRSDPPPFNIERRFVAHQRTKKRVRVKEGKKERETSSAPTNKTQRTDILLLLFLCRYTLASASRKQKGKYMTRVRGGCRKNEE